MSSGTLVINMTVFDDDDDKSSGMSYITVFTVSHYKKLKGKIHQELGADCFDLLTLYMLCCLKLSAWAWLDIKTARLSPSFSSSV